MKDNTKEEIKSFESDPEVTKWLETVSEEMWELTTVSGWAEFDENKVIIENSISPWVSYEGIGRLGIWWFDTKSLHLAYNFYLKGGVQKPDQLIIPCEKHEIKKVLRDLSEKAKQKIL